MKFMFWVYTILVLIVIIAVIFGIRYIFSKFNKETFIRDTLLKAKSIQNGEPWDLQKSYDSQESHVMNKQKYNPNKDFIVGLEHVHEHDPVSKQPIKVKKRISKTNGFIINKKKSHVRERPRVKQVKNKNTPSLMDWSISNSKKRRIKFDEIVRVKLFDKNEPPSVL